MTTMRKFVEPPVADIEVQVKRWLSEAPEREESERLKKQAAERRAQEAQEERVLHGRVIARKDHHLAHSQPLPSDAEVEHWQKWDRWCEAHIAEALEVEREFQRDVIAQCLAAERDRMRKEMRSAFENEVKALDARISDLNSLVSTLLKRENPPARARDGEFKFAHERDDAAGALDLPNFLPASVLHKTTVN